MVDQDPQISIATPIRHHSPDGIEWGYGGSGPADCALVILAHCLPVGCDGLPTVKLWDGECSHVAWDLHQRFKASWIAVCPYSGYEFNGQILDSWIDGQVAEWIERPYVRDLLELAGSEFS